MFTDNIGGANNTPVKLGFVDGTSAEILEGVAATDRIIVIGKQALADGQPVRVVEEK